MISSLFEIYDPYSFFYGLSFNWFPTLLIFLFSVSEFWCLTSFIICLYVCVLSFLAKEFVNFYCYNKMKVSLLLFISLFLFILFINILGLIPYVFACSSHFVFSISFGFPFWVSFILLGWFNFNKSFFSHLVPLGTPLILISFMVVIESISMLIRPWSLSIRLMSNMISGHLLMVLLGNCGFYLFLVQLCLFMFEFFVCFIQAFVFSVLLTLYSSEI
uniref:ATP synthase subunit a n=1 Tax=Bemisia tabaci TaxID=7038 RepID=A0A678P8J0_BEMTA|nr:ATP synthase F0 subunit 6 [Bemisia tabaci]QPB46170.1 ATP synthase F0 subunit 6 [Bemisia tabaci]QPB46196.1 ATP synthase F0 subunit 6 [Bemisia tabaci]QPB46209.1 ATP synthase F0 subunit 6 [Bemisia tabaci]